MFNIRADSTAAVRFKSFNWVSLLLFALHLFHIIPTQVTAACQYKRCHSSRLFSASHKKCIRKHQVQFLITNLYRVPIDCSPCCVQIGQRYYGKLPFLFSNDRCTTFPHNLEQTTRHPALASALAPVSAPVSTPASAPALVLATATTPPSPPSPPSPPPAVFHRSGQYPSSVGNTNRSHQTLWTFYCSCAEKRCPHSSISFLQLTSSTT